MPTHSLPDHPNLRHLKNQAKDLLRSGHAPTLAAAQFQVARQYGFASWPKLKIHLETLGLAGPLKQAIDRNDLAAVQSLMTSHPGLHAAPLGYRNNGPLTWAAECRGSAGLPAPERLAIVRWMLAHGSDVHQGGDGPLMRAALDGSRIPMMEVLVEHGADVNARWNGHYPILFAPCETLDPASLAWLLARGADPHCGAFDFLIGTYLRGPDLAACIELLRQAGAQTRYAAPGVLPILTGRNAELQELLDENPALVHERFPDLHFGATGARQLTLQGATLLHVAAEFGNTEAVRLLLESGADPNAPAACDATGLGGQTPLFHAATQYDDGGLPVVTLLLDRGADLSVRARVPGHYESPGEVIECTALGYARRFPGGASRAAAALDARGAPE